MRQSWVSFFRSQRSLLNRKQPSTNQPFHRVSPLTTSISQSCQQLIYLLSSSLEFCLCFFHYITELQNGLGWKGHQRSFSPTPLSWSKSGFYQTRLLRTQSSLVLSNSRDGASTTTLNNLYQCLTHPHSEEFLPNIVLLKLHSLEYLGPQLFLALQTVHSSARCKECSSCSEQIQQSGGITVFRTMLYVIFTSYSNFGEICHYFKLQFMSCSICCIKKNPANEPLLV